MATLCWLMAGCKSDNNYAGGSLLIGETTEIRAYADTFDVQSQLLRPNGIITSPDSFLLGEMETSLGTMRAEVLTQLACPEGFVYPANAVVDSVQMVLYYHSWVGDGNAPLELEIRRLDQGAIYYWQRYQTDFDISEFCSMSDETLVTETNRIVVAAHPTDSVYSSAAGKYLPVLRFKTNQAFTDRMSSIRSFASQEEFNNQFKGLYIRSLFGGSTVLNMSDMGMVVFYHFTYERAGRDTTVNDTKFFYSNAEVRQINHIEYRDADAVYDKLSKDPLYNYVIAPAGMYTRLRVPMRGMAERVFGRINENKPYGARPYINRARVTVRVQNVYEGSLLHITRDDWAQPAQQMLLVEESHLADFFVNRNLTSDTVAILSSLTTSIDSVGNYLYYYSFDLATILSNQLRLRDVNDFHYDESQLAQLPDTLSMVLVPVTTTTTTGTSGSTSLVGIDEQQTISATIIYSAENPDNKMNLEVVYSGFPYEW